MKNTVFSIELELKLLALIVIVLPIPPNAGSIESMIGWGKINDIKNNIDDIYLNTLKSTKYYPTMCVGLQKVAILIVGYLKRSFLYNSIGSFCLSKGIIIK